MPLQPHEAGDWPPPLADRLRGDASAADVAAGVAAVWKDIDQALHPIIGHRGVAALYHRSLSSAALRYPWLPVNPTGALATIDPMALRAALTRREAAEAAAASVALFAAFRDLLASLIGASLTDRLLLSTWTPAPGTARAQDTDP
jgi:hypothetical protein